MVLKNTFTEKAKKEPNGLQCLAVAAGIAATVSLVAWPIIGAGFDAWSNREEIAAAVAQKFASLDPVHFIARPN